MGHYDSDYDGTRERQRQWGAEQRKAQIERVDDSDQLSEEEKIILRAVLKGKHLGILKD